VSILNSPFTNLSFLSLLSSHILAGTMPQIILSINAGSSSVKVSAFSYEEGTSDPKLLADIQVAGLTAPPATLSYDRGDVQIKHRELGEIAGQEGAYAYILDHLTSDPDLPELQHPDDVEFACHRVVHGGSYTEPVVINQDTLHHLEALSDLAPLHNAGALTIVKAVHEKCPKASNIAFFDTTFHSTLPKHICTYPINQSIAERNQLRKYGFHGLSYAFIIKATASFLQTPVDQTNIIALHLGSGASACAIENGKSFDTSMGLTPLAGLPGATRSGSVDPSLIFHVTSDASRLAPGSTKEMHITEAEQILNKESGWKVLAGTTDFGVISSKAISGKKEDEVCKLAFDIFVDRITDLVGAYYVKLGGKVDALVFAGGIGEKGALLRKAVVENVKCLGFELDEAANEKGLGKGEETVVEIGKEGARHKILVCQTDEQTEMARECVEGAGRFRR
jgi:acetate kinase